MAKSKTPVQEFVDNRFEEVAESQGLIDDGKVQLNVRLSRFSVFLLQEVAQRLDMGRPALSAQLLDLAINEAASHLGIDDFESKEFKARWDAFRGETVK